MVMLGGMDPTPDDVAARAVAALERVAAAHRALLQTVATRLGLSSLQVGILRRVAGAVAPVRGTDLADDLGVRPPTISDAVATLRRKGLVEQQVGVDARARAVALTPAGAALAARIEEELEPFRRAVAAAGPDALGAALAVIRGLWREGLLAVDRSCATCRHHVPGRTPAGRCDLLGVELTPATLRVDCPDHDAA